MSESSTSGRYQFQGKPDDMREYTFEELSTYLEHFYDQDEGYEVGGPYTEDVDEVAFISTDDDGLYAELQGAGFNIVFDEDGDTTRFYVLELQEPMFRSFVQEIEDGDRDV